MELQERIKSLSASLFERLQTIRRHLHQYPELSFEEVNTSQFIQEQLKSAGISFTAGHVKTGIIASIQGKNPIKKTLLIRADMDALPIEEKNNVAYKSKNKGVMHACGHDVHSTVALGAAFILNELKNEFEGTVKIMFQPGEELLPGGAQLMIKAGVLEQPKVDKALALHVYPELEAGSVGFKQGMYMASTDELYITVQGKGGHAAMPERYTNPLIAASAILLEIQNTFMNKDALNGTLGETTPTVVAFGKIEGRGATNVIPDTVDMAGTFRTMNEAWRYEVHQKLNRLVEKTANDYSCRAELRIERGYPFLVNDAEFTQHCSAAAIEFLGSTKVQDLPLRMTAEDFAFISQAVPSCFFRLGTGNSKKGITAGVHTANFDIDESALQTGSGVMAWLAIQELNS
ncbi:MAG: M20 family metallopeptidase [Bacteroidia bacterium]|nr:M20 family metallopeptidase [Bacteroidia bacterium]